MKIWVSLSLFAMFGVLQSAFANEAYEACNAQYPEGSYEEQERQGYIAQCMAAYTPPEMPQEEEVSSSEVVDTSMTESDLPPDEPSGDEAYYEGTVDDYVNSLPGE